MNKSRPLTPKQLEACIAALSKAATKTIGEGIAFEQLKNESARDASLDLLQRIEARRRNLELQLQALQPRSQAEWQAQASEWLL
jgi:type II secretory pathway component PulM